MVMIRERHSLVRQFNATFEYEHRIKFCCATSGVADYLRSEFSISLESRSRLGVEDGACSNGRSLISEFLKVIPMKTRWIIGDVSSPADRRGAGIVRPIALASYWAMARVFVTLGEVHVFLPWLTVEWMPGLEKANWVSEIAKEVFEMYCKPSLLGVIRGFSQSSASLRKLSSNFFQFLPIFFISFIKIFQWRRVKVHLL